MPSSPGKNRFWLEGPVIVVSILLAFGEGLEALTSELLLLVPASD